ncbi:hypothetical protein GYMLUDRAFT_879794 [Collybiopsis luxurians FD-317 M1]|uniref:Uncharacterized protein n=1 Tax=Collybiopsis luxurians FD-317 M1 TaxID=944289 RepID=A0A0D0BKK0_9AGAR|nr:hypothetical protein GYMLUDRAFT_879794 [Collybiopsis luxurians FD-317 M1]
MLETTKIYPNPERVVYAPLVLVLLLQFFFTVSLVAFYISHKLQTQRCIMGKHIHSSTHLKKSSCQLVPLPQEFKKFYISTH